MTEEWEPVVAERSFSHRARCGTSAGWL